MKNVLLLTDLRQSEAYLNQLAINLCSRMKCNLQLLNVYNAVPYVPAFDGGSYQDKWYSELYDDHCESFSHLAEKIRELSVRLPACDHRPKVDAIITEGDLGEEVKKSVLKGNIELIIMGAGKSGVVSHLLFGDSVSTVIQNSSLPVLILPADTLALTAKSKVVYATDFNKNDLGACMYLSSLGKILDFTFEVVHVKREKGIDTTSELDRESNFLDRLRSLNLSEVKYLHLTGENVLEALEQWSKILQAEVLALSEHHRALFASMFKKNTVKHAISQQKMPLLIFPENFSNNPG